MYPNQNDMMGTEQNSQNEYQQNNGNIGYAADQYQGTDAGQNTGNFQNNTYQNNGYHNGYGNNNYQNEYANNNFQNYNNYQPYQQLNPMNNSGLELEEPVKISEWVLALVLMMIPCVNIIMMFVFAFSKTEKKSKSNFFKAYLIYFAIVFALTFLFGMAIVFMAAIAS